MPVQIHINGENAEHALAELKGLSAGLYVGAKPAFVPETGTGSLAAEAPTAVVGEVSQPVQKPRKSRGGKAEATDAVDLNEKQGIQTGGERVDAATVDAPVTDEQVKKLLTLDDVRTAAKPYIDKFTMANASVDLMKCLSDAVPGKDRFSAYEGATQEELAAAVKALQMASAATLRYGQTAA